MQLHQQLTLHHHNVQLQIKQLFLKLRLFSKVKNTSSRKKCKKKIIYARIIKLKKRYQNRIKIKLIDVRKYSIVKIIKKNIKD